MNAANPPPRKRPFYRSLYGQVVIGVLLGVLVGALDPSLGAALKPLGDAFIKLIKMMLAPIVFGTIVVGIARMGDLKEAGRVGVKALVYFEIASTMALLIGLVVSDTLQPGSGMHVDPAKLDAGQISSYVATAKTQNLTGFFLDIIPNSIVDAFARGAMLQVILFSVLFGAALANAPGRCAPLVDWIDSVLHGLFGVVRIIMYLAPLGAFGAIAFTVGNYGLASLISLGRLMLGVYVTSIVFVVAILGTIARLGGVSLWKLIRYIKDEIAIVFATCSTEAVLPQMMEKMERLGCARPVVGIVLPTGYTFNADGTSIYLSMAALFVAQALDIPLSLGDQLLILGVLMLTSKGSAGVAGAGFVTLAATLASMDKIPVAGLALLLGVDRFINEARAVTNLIGNAVATVVVARWEKGFDAERAKAILDGGEPLD
jgi:DAACS family dicarboxylate/amino acid:cation (Na+ or H+) symporter/aerobic C4-dicarboxylate transport protein